MPPKSAAPPSAKKEKVTDANAEQQCLDYLVSTNRPYNATDIHKNLHEPFSKAVAQKALTSLAERNEILSKVASKSVVYCAKQETQEPVDQGTLDEMDQRITSLNGELKLLKDSNKKLSEVLDHGCYEKSTTELQAREVELDEQIIAARKALKPILSSKRKLYTAAETAKIDRDYNSAREHHRRHKREFENMFFDLMEMMGKGKADVAEWREELGIDEIEEDPRAKWIEEPLAIKKAK